MLIEKERHYSVIQSFAADNTCNQNEYMVYDYNQNRVGYFVEYTKDNTFEIYHNASTDFDDYTSIDYEDSFDNALEIIVREINYDLN